MQFYSCRCSKKTASTDNINTNDKVNIPKNKYIFNLILSQERKFDFLKNIRKQNKSWNIIEGGIDVEQITNFTPSGTTLTAVWMEKQKYLSHWLM